MMYEEGNLKYDMIQVLDNHPNNAELRKGIYELAELLAIDLMSSKIEFDAYMFKHTTSDFVGVQFYGQPYNEESRIDLLSKVRTAFGGPNNGWAGKKVRVTIERLVD